MNEKFRIKHSMNCTSTNLIYAITCAGCGHNYIGETGDVLRYRVTVHKQQFRDPQIRMLGVRKHIDECAAGLTPQFTIFFRFTRFSDPRRAWEKTKRGFFSSLFQNINQFLMIWNYANCSRGLGIARAIIFVITIISVTNGLSTQRPWSMRTRGISVLVKSN